MKTSFAVMTTLCDSVLHLIQERELSADWLNDGGIDILFNEAWEDIDHSPYSSRDDLRIAHEKDRKELEDFVLKGKLNEKR